MWCLLWVQQSKRPRRINSRSTLGFDYFWNFDRFEWSEPNTTKNCSSVWQHSKNAFDLTYNTHAHAHKHTSLNFTTMPSKYQSFYTDALPSTVNLFNNVSQSPRVLFKITAQFSIQFRSINGWLCYQDLENKRSGCITCLNFLWPVFTLAYWRHENRNKEERNLDGDQVWIAFRWNQQVFFFFFGQRR